MLSTVQHIKQSVFKLRRCAILSISPQSVNIWELWRPAAGVLEMNVGPLLFDRGFIAAKQSRVFFVVLFVS